MEMGIPGDVQRLHELPLGNPTEGKLLPLIDKAAEAGIECFCIDAGWFSKVGKPGPCVLETGNPAPGVLGKKGLGGILAYIILKGMIPGVRLEMEVYNEDARLAQKLDSWFLIQLYSFR